MKICLVAQNASLKFGGEASLPWLLFKHLRNLNQDVHLVAHGRTAPEVLAAFPAASDRLHFAPETHLDRLIWRAGSLLPGKIDAQTFTILRHIYNQHLQKRIVRKLIKEKGIDIVHEINPVSPKQVSLMYGLGVPVVIGPLAGGMTYPPAFSEMESTPERIVESAGRTLSQFLNVIYPGKRRAAGLIVANEQARDALPNGTRGKIYFVPDVGVDLSVWSNSGAAAPRTDSGVRFVFLGRLAAWKGVKFLLDAFSAVADQNPSAHLDILGDGEMLDALQEQSRVLNLTERVTFVGWVSAHDGASRLRAADVLVLPSLHEVGGIVILEAMAAGLPVIATDWGGPSQHVTDETGIRVKPDSKDGFVKGLSDAMLRLAADPDLRRKMGEAGKKRVAGNLYDWDSKTRRFLQIYAELLGKV
jgi:glycosyltransferase involved in cell wall biosynthesis